MTTSPIRIGYFTDVLCIWAHIAQLRVDAIQTTYGDKVAFDFRFVSIFGDTRRKMEASWGSRGGHAGFNKHLIESVKQFPEIRLNPEVWLAAQPASSASAHLFLKAVGLGEAEGGQSHGSTERMLIALRKAFFEDARDISDWSVQTEVAEANAVAIGEVETRVRNGSAHAALMSDYADADAQKIQGSPTFVLNDGRQKLYGNVGYRIIEANIQELLREPASGQASWC
ncbi:MAG: DsbA family protein [Hyphomonadaceae bacterium]